MLAPQPPAAFSAQHPLGMLNVTGGSPPGGEAAGLFSPGCGLTGVNGEVSEWLKELVSKTSRANTLVGSNPTLSATNTGAVSRR